MPPKLEKTASFSKKASSKRAPVKPAKLAKENQTTREASALQSTATPVRKGHKTDAKPTRRQPSRNCKKVQSTHQDTKPSPKHGGHCSGKPSKQLLSPRGSSRERGKTQERPSQLSGKIGEQIFSNRSTQQEEFGPQLVSQKYKRLTKSAVSAIQSIRMCRS